MQITSGKQYKSHIFTFPMAYCNGALHVGHCYVLLQTDVRKRYYSSLNCNTVSIFPWHLTGLHIPLSFNKFIKKDEAVRNSVKQAFALSDSELSEAEENIKTIEDWIGFIQLKNKKAIENLDIDINWENTHGTTVLEPAYDSFVNWIFEKLKRNDLIKEAMHYVIWCNNCNQAIGDHDRSKGENTYIAEYSFLKIWNKEYSAFLILLNTDDSLNQLVSNTSKVYYNKTLNENWILTPFMKKLLIDYEFEFVSDYIDSQLNTEYLINSNSASFRQIGYKSDFKSNLFTEDVMCRCGSDGIIKKKLESFICYSNLAWKAKTRKYIERIVLNPLAKTQVYNQLINMRDWPFSRIIGLGSYYNQKLIDPLSDSTMFFIYSLFHPVLEKKKYDFEFWENVMTYNNKTKSELQKKLNDLLTDAVNSYFIETTGKDLLSNHILFTIYFQALFDLNITKEVNAVGFILNKSEKMSKSKLNTIYISDFANLNSDLVRYWLSNLSEGLKDGDFSEITLQNLTREYNASLKLYELWQIHNFNSVEKYTLCDIQFLKEISKLIFEYKRKMDGENAPGNIKSAYGLIARNLSTLLKTYVELVVNPNIQIIALVHMFLNASLSLICVKGILQTFKLSSVFEFANTLQLQTQVIVDNSLQTSTSVALKNKTIYHFLMQLNKDISKFLKNKTVNELTICISDKKSFEIINSNENSANYFFNKYNILTKIIYDPNNTRETKLKYD